jgi:hypothetical protein
MFLELTRLKRLPVISREHLRKTRTIYFYCITLSSLDRVIHYKHLLGISNTNLQNGISNNSAFKKGDWYFKYRLVLWVPIGTLGADWYFGCRLVLWVPIGTLGADWYFGCRLVLRVPIVTSNADCYFKCRLLL